MTGLEPLPGTASLLERIAQLVTENDVCIATAESLTGGHIATHLAAAVGAGGWFRGGIVAYQKSTKFKVLGLPEGKVVSAEAAERMAISTQEMFAADYVVATTGSGGPEQQDDMPVGTVFTAVCDSQGEVHTKRHHFDGEVEEILEQTVIAALTELHSALAR